MTKTLVNYNRGNPMPLDKLFVFSEVSTQDEPEFNGLCYMISKKAILQSNLYEEYGDKILLPKGSEIIYRLGFGMKYPNNILGVCTLLDAKNTDVPLVICDSLDLHRHVR